MPCTDGGIHEPTTKEKLVERTAFLCGIMNAIEKLGLSKQVLKNVDWEEVGKNEHEFKYWWNNHQKTDKERIKREKRAEKVAIKIKEAKKVDAARA
jgi:hypothetical protein